MSGNPLKLMTFNLLRGGGDEARFGRILDIVTAARPNVLVLQECLGWEDGKRLARVAGAMGTTDTSEHVHLGMARPRGSGKRYHVAIVSTLALRDARTYNDPARVGHCIVCCTVSHDVWPGRPLRLLGVHFDAKSEDLRLVETRYLASLVDPDAFRRAPHLLLGDLNALTRNDPYPVNLADSLRRASIYKYGIPPRFEVMDALASFGWVDLLDARRPASGDWVTAPRDRGGVRIDYRTDYVLGSPGAAEKLQEVEVADATGASDHHAVIATFDG